MEILPLIEAKRDGHAFSREQIQAIVDAFAHRSAPDYQLAALLMAVFFRGLDVHETSTLAMAMRDSGEVLAFPDEPRPVVDKHSTGGVGDKVTLPLVPLLACLNFRVPMVSGRGLGITGGTLDKLESIPGFRVNFSSEDIVRQVQEVGGVICATGNLAPADDVMYALRDVTGTVESISLITASILSKKLAEGLNALILDVKVGSAASIPEMDGARRLASAMVALGTACGVNTRAMLTDMDAPLGRSAGNWLEVRESIDCLEGRGPEDLTDLVLECAAHLMHQTGLAPNVDEGRARARACLESGAPRRKWDELLLAQGADLDALERQWQGGPTAPVVVDVRADRSGFIARLDAHRVGEIVRDLGAGRLSKGAALDYDVGVDDMKKPGDSVAAGDVLARLHARTEAQAHAALPELRATFTLDDAPPSLLPLVREVL